jgi:integrase
LIIDRLREVGSKYALPAEVVLRCGLRLSEVAGLKGEDIDLENLVMHIKGKGGRHRTISIPADLAEQLDASQQYVFKPSASWKSSFYQAVRRAARKLGIKINGVHRLRSNFAQNEHKNLIAEGLTDRLARMQVSQKLGHNRIEVVGSYIPNS